MEVVEHHIRYESRGDVFTIYPLGDIHAGVRTCNEKLLDQYIERIKSDPLARWFGMGDLIEAIGWHDPRFDINQLSPWLLKRLASTPITRKEKQAAGITVCGIQIEWITEKLTPIADKCLGLHLGNHEEIARLKYENEATYSLSANLKVPYLGMCSYNALRFQRCENGPVQSLIVYIHHGYFTGRLAGGVALNLERLFMNHPQARICIVGHAHKRQVVPVEGWDIKFSSKKPLHAVTRYAIMTGPFKQAYAQPGDLPTWEERKGFPPSPLGPVLVQYKPDDDDVKVIL